ncbi:MAG: glycosyltransferase family 2 protein [Clostridiales bacterium]|jgi:glycosyltransferase involved in cell wall biosynthesis|nr:glycosyltransferase family 2 protein [Clostridiales bacterium]
MTITACYIVKNEEAVLNRSIESVKAVCQELIVVDTGSEDDTVRVARDAGARVLHFKWRADFAAARNFAIEHATGDVILFIDADEWFDPALTKAHAAVIEGQIKRGATIFNVCRINYFKDTPPTELYVMRAFKNRAGLKYVNPVHEKLNQTGHREYNLPRDLFVLYHSGYAGDFSGKAEYYLNIMLAQADEKTGRQNNPTYEYYIAREASQLGRMQLAAEHMEAFFCLAKKETFPARWMIAAHKLRNMLALVKAPQLYTDEERAQYVRAYELAFPRHPAPQMIKGLYAFEYEGDIAAMLQAYAGMEARVQAYNEADYPGDFSDISAEGNLVNMSRGAAAHLLGDPAGALDYFTEAFRVSRSAAALNYILHIIEGQSASDIAAFLQTLYGEMDEEALTQLLNMLTYYPDKQDLYVYYAKKLLDMTRRHSDLTALISIPLERCAHAARVARDVGGEAGGALLCAAAFAADDPALCEADAPEAVRAVAAAYFGEGSAAGFHADQWRLIALGYRMLLFTRSEAALWRMDAMLKDEKYMRFLIKSGYYGVPWRYRDVADSFDLNTEALPPAEAAYANTRLAQAYVGLRRFDEALACYETALRLTGDYAAVRRDMGIISNLSPAHEAAARALYTRYAAYRPRETAPDEKRRACELAVRGVFMAPELGRLTMTLR